MRLATSSPLRVALLCLVGLLLADYIWVRTHPESSRTWLNRRSGMFLGGSACPDSASLSAAQNAQQAMLGEAEYGWRILGLDGREATLEEFRGKVVFVNVWATWCGPCINEMPSIQALYNSVGQDGVAFVLVSEEEKDIVKRFVEQEKYSFPVFTTDRLPDVFKARGIPATYIVNRQGGIAYKHVGSADWNTESCRKLLRGLL